MRACKAKCCRVAAADARCSGAAAGCQAICLPLHAYPGRSRADQRFNNSHQKTANACALLLSADRPASVQLSQILKTARTKLRSLPIGCRRSCSGRRAVPASGRERSGGGRAPACCAPSMAGHSIRINHSGGSPGADAAWRDIGAEFGVRAAGSLAEVAVPLDRHG